MAQSFRLLGLLGVGTFALASGCSSTRGTDGNRDGGVSNSGGAGAVANNGSGGVNGFVVSTGGAADSGASTAKAAALPKAQDTTDGLYPVSGDTAAALEDPKKSCDGWTGTPKAIPAIMEFVIDESYSMARDSSNPTDPNAAKKWPALVQTMPSVFSALQALPGPPAVGVLYYNCADNTCFNGSRASQVAIAPLDAAQLTKLDNSVSGTSPNTSSAYTPTHGAWSYALSLLTGYSAPANYENSPKYIVLITDGLPTVSTPVNNKCTTEAGGYIGEAEYDAQIQSISDLGKQAGIKTFVVGVAGSDNPNNAPYDPLCKLSQLAVAGGTEQPAGCTPVCGTPNGTTLSQRGTYCHFDLSTATDFAGALTGALAAIGSSLLSCTYSVPTSTTGDPIDVSKTVLVFHDGSTQTTDVVLQNTSSNCDRGWHFTDSTNTVIEICGQTCDAIQGSANSQLNLVFGCVVDTVGVH